MDDMDFSSFCSAKVFMSTSTWPVAVTIFLQFTTGSGLVRVVSLDIQEGTS